MYGRVCDIGADLQWEALVLHLTVEYIMDWRRKGGAYMMGAHMNLSHMNKLGSKGGEFCGDN